MSHGQILQNVLSILNIGLQNCALTREKGSDELEKKLKSCTSMAAVRELGQKDPDVKEQWETTIEPVRRIVENRFRRLTLKDEPFQVLDPLPDAEVDYLSRHLSFLFPGLDKDKLVKSSTMRVKAYTEWVQKHCRQRQYVFQIRKCDDPECCSPPVKHREWLPDPMLQDNGDHYKAFNDVFGTDTNENDRPTLVKPVDNAPGETSTKRDLKKKDNVDPLVNIVPDDEALNGDSFTFTGQNARVTVICRV